MTILLMHYLCRYNCECVYGCIIIDVSNLFITPYVIRPIFHISKILDLDLVNEWRYTYRDPIPLFETSRFEYEFVGTN